MLLALLVQFGGSAAHPKDVDRAAAGGQQVMTRAREGGDFRPQAATRLVVVGRIELIQRGEQALQVLGMPGMDDVEIECRNRCSAQDGRDATNDD